MGGPKAALVVDGRTLLAHHLERLYALGCAPILVVLHEDVGPPEALPPSVRILAARTPSQAASLALAVAALPASAEAVLVTPVDLLPPRLDTLRTLVAALGEGHLAVSPTFGARGGHPVIVRRALLTPYARGDAPPLRALLDEAGARRLRVPVDDERVCGDLDRPSDLADARALRT